MRDRKRTGDGPSTAALGNGEAYSGWQDGRAQRARANANPCCETHRALAVRKSTLLVAPFLSTLNV